MGYVDLTDYYLVAHLHQIKQSIQPTTALPYIDINCNVCPAFNLKVLLLVDLQIEWPSSLDLSLAISMEITPLTF